MTCACSPASIGGAMFRLHWLTFSAAAGGVVALLAVDDGTFTFGFYVARGGVGTPRAVDHGATDWKRPPLAALTRSHPWLAVDDGTMDLKGPLLAAVTRLQLSAATCGGRQSFRGCY